MKRLLMVGVLVAMPVWAETYKCEVEGRVMYADAPCGKSQQVVKVIPSSKPPPVVFSNYSSIHSIQVGMSLEQVLKLIGPPTHTNTSQYASGRHEQLVYGRYGYVYLQNGVVTSVSY